MEGDGESTEGGDGEHYLGVVVVVAVVVLLVDRVAVVVERAGELLVVAVVGGREAIGVGGAIGAIDGGEHEAVQIVTEAHDHLAHLTRQMLQHPLMIRHLHGEAQQSAIVEDIIPNDVMLL